MAYGSAPPQYASPLAAMERIGAQIANEWADDAADHDASGYDHLRGALTVSSQPSPEPPSTSASA